MQDWRTGYPHEPLQFRYNLPFPLHVADPDAEEPSAGRQVRQQRLVMVTPAWIPCCPQSQLQLVGFMMAGCLFRLGSVQRLYLIEIGILGAELTFQTLL